jgi:Ca2+-binding RTX toxin-like protein
LLLGEDGNDWLYGGLESNSLWGGAGSDVSVGDDDVDVAVMGDGNDVSWGYSGNDYFYMGNGNDTAYGGDGVDVMLGEAGNDYFDGGDGTDYFFLGSGGSDTVFVAAGSGPKVINDFEAGSLISDTIQLAGSNWSTLADVLAHTTNMGSYSIIALSPSTVIWVIGVTPNQFHVNDFTIIN